MPRTRSRSRSRSTRRAKRHSKSRKTRRHSKSRRTKRSSSRSSTKESKRVVYLSRSSRSDKKFMVRVDGRTIHFGARGMSDYTKHKDSSRKQRYISRHRRRESWSRGGMKSAGFWAKNVLWNKPSLSASKKDIERRFGITIRSGR